MEARRHATQNVERQRGTKMSTNVERAGEIVLSSELTKRPINPGAEKWLGIPIPVLDNGFIYLVDYMGNDQSIEQAARVSYGGGTRSVNETIGLVRYLRRHRHTTPFEMAELKFHMKLPIVVAAQAIRHRTANINQLSARYSILDSEFYIPDPAVIGVQSSANRQGRGEEVDLTRAEEFRQWLIDITSSAYKSYENFLNDDGSGKPFDPQKDMIARELSRMGLPQNIYTQWYWKCDLHNIFHFLGLRMDSHAQWEIRQYANAMGQIVADAFPIAWKAFEDYELKAKSLTLPEQQILSLLIRQKGLEISQEEIINLALQVGLTNKRERQEMVDKFRDLGFF